MSTSTGHRRGRRAPARENPHTAAGGAGWGEPGASVAVLAVHGRAQSPADMEALAQRLDVDGLRWRAPAAEGSTWYPYGFMESRPDDDPWLAWALEAVDLELRQLADAGWPPERVVLLGFSQGACLLAHWALLHPRRYAGLVTLTGGYIGTEDEQVAFAGDFGGTPVVLAGREADPWVPHARMAETEGWLRKLGCAVTSLVEPGEAHEVSDNAAELARQLLRRARDDAARG